MVGKLQFFLTHQNKSDFSTFKKELQNSLLSNINYNGDNNEKTKKIKKHGWEYSSWEFSGWEFSLGSLIGGNFPGVSFPDNQ